MHLLLKRMEGEGMISSKSTVPVVAVLLALSLAAGPAVAEQSCKKVNANLKAFSEFFVEDPENPTVCNGFEFCQYAEVRGTLNGLWWIYGDFADFVPVAGGKGLLADVIGVFETNQGDLYADDIELANQNAPDGGVFHSAVEGGTGKYEGASGWLAGWFFFEPPTGGNIGGEICWIDD